MGEEPPGQILGNLGADRIFEFLDMYYVETPPLDIDRGPLLDMAVGWKKVFPHTGNSRADRMLGWNISRELSGAYFGPIDYYGTRSQPFCPDNTTFSPKSAILALKIPFCTYKVPILYLKCHFVHLKVHFWPWKCHFGPRKHHFGPQKWYFRPKK